MTLEVARAALGLGHLKANLPVILIYDKPSLAKQSQALGEHPDFEVQENLSQGNTWRKFSPGRGVGPGRIGLR